MILACKNDQLEFLDKILSAHVITIEPEAIIAVIKNGNVEMMERLRKCPGFKWEKELAIEAAKSVYSARWFEYGFKETEISILVQAYNHDYFKPFLYQGNRVETMGQLRDIVEKYLLQSESVDWVWNSCKKEDLMRWIWKNIKIREPVDNWPLEAASKHNFPGFFHEIEADLDETEEEKVRTLLRILCDRETSRDHSPFYIPFDWLFLDISITEEFIFLLLTQFSKDEEKHEILKIFEQIPLRLQRKNYHIVTRALKYDQDATKETGFLPIEKWLRSEHIDPNRIFTDCNYRHLNSYHESILFEHPKISTGSAIAALSISKFNLINLYLENPNAVMFLGEDSAFHIYFLLHRICDCEEKELVKKMLDHPNMQYDYKDVFKHAKDVETVQLLLSPLELSETARERGNRKLLELTSVSSRRGRDRQPETKN